MAPVERLKRLDATSVRLTSSGLGLGLGVVWVVALSTGATFWLTWMIALAALACLGTVALVPEGRAGFIAAANLGLVGMVLGACWIVALLTGSTRWLVWCSFGAAWLVLVGAIGTALAAAVDWFR